MKARAKFEPAAALGCALAFALLTFGGHDAAGAEPGGGRVPFMVAQTVYKCAQAGRTVYSDVPCEGLAATVKIKDSSFDTARTEKPVGAGSVARQAAGTGPARAAQADSATAGQLAATDKARPDGRCRYLDEQIRSIDVRMRQPYPPSEGDQLKDERKRHNDERFSTGC